MKRITLAAAATVLALGFGNSALAGVCEDQTVYQERANGIPAHLLTAIARVESGRYDAATGKVQAWPWTVTSPEGDVKYETKWQAIEAVNDLQRRGVTNIDVGCMQINLGHHPNAFTSLNVAFEPAYNVAYAAGLLLSHYRSSGDWRLAAAHYHSTDPDVYGRYLAKVEDVWDQMRADAGYAAWVDDGTDGRAHAWAVAQARVDARPTTGWWAWRGNRWTWTTRHAWTRRVDPGHPWTPDQPAWYGDRVYHILPFPAAGTWRPVGTTRFN